MICNHAFLSNCYLYVLNITICVVSWLLIIKSHWTTNIKIKYQIALVEPRNCNLCDSLSISGEYDQNRCNLTDTSCRPCPERLPSCRGLPDGDQPANGFLWTDRFVTCVQNRTLAVSRCNPGAIFDPTQLNCVEQIPKCMFLHVKTSLEWKHCYKNVHKNWFYLLIILISYSQNWWILSSKSKVCESASLQLCIVLRLFICTVSFGSSSRGMSIPSSVRFH